MRDPSRARVTGPLELFAVSFAAELARLGYTANAAGIQMNLMAHLSRWLVANGLGTAALDERTVEAFLAARRDAGYVMHRTPRSLAPLLAHLRLLGIAPAAAPPDSPTTPLEELLERYRRYLAHERGLTAESVSGYAWAVRPFLATRLRDGGLDVEGVRGADVTEFVAAECPRHSVGHAKLIVTALRSLLGFLHLEGEIDGSLQGVVPSVAGRRLAGLPRGLDPADVRRMLQTCDRRTSLGRRDFAVITLMVRLGLRKREVAALTLEDVDWRAGEIVIRGKGERSERLPLPADVGEAIAAHLRAGRAPSAEGRFVFHRHKAPHTRLTPGAAGHIVKAAASRAGLDGVHAHRLRHTAATEMLRAGAPLAEIGQVLRHRSALSTAIYAKVDRDALREIARPWPGDPS